MGFAQKPMLSIYINGINKNIIPYFNPIISAKIPTIKGIKAPPIIPVHNIPENEPWCFGTEFNANENIIDHITDRKKPTAGKK